MQTPITAKTPWEAMGLTEAAWLYYRITIMLWLLGFYDYAPFEWAIDHHMYLETIARRRPKHELRLAIMVLEKFYLEYTDESNPVA